MFSKDDKMEKIDASSVYDSTQVGQFTCVSNINDYTFN